MLRAISSPLRRLTRKVRNAGSDDRGAALIEFALIVPAFIALLVAILQTAIVFFAQETLESAAETVARQITTGQVQKSGMNQAAFKTLACKGLPAFMACDANLLVDVQQYADFSSINTTTPKVMIINGQPTEVDSSGKAVNTSFQVGGAGNIVVVRLMYTWSVVPGPLNFSLSNVSSSQRLLVATTVAKTEPYQ